MSGARTPTRAQVARRRVTGLAGVAVLVAVVAVLLGAGDDKAAGGDGYLVRAVFDNASFVIPGEDVKVAGVTVGTIEDVDVTEENKAAVVLKIEDPAFRPFRADAHCRIALQSLIGEQFVECEPTQERGDGVKPAPVLAKVPEGRRGEGQYLLPVARTTTPVNLDLLNNIMRLPQRERLRIVINELGAGLASNGPELNKAIKRASPALQEADTLVKTLADQNEVLARLVDASDEALAPLAERREELTGFIEHAGDTARATAEEGANLERNFERLPAFLDELKPAAERFGALADQMGPAVATLGARADTINETTERLGPLTEAATPALKTFGKVATKGRETFPKLDGVLDDLNGLVKPLRPLAIDLGRLSKSFGETDGIEHLMRFIYNYTGSVNGKDELGHYIRAALSAGGCIDRTPEPGQGCAATFDPSGESASALKGEIQPPAAEAAKAGLADYLLGSGSSSGLAATPEAGR